MLSLKAALGLGGFLLLLFGGLYLWGSQGWARARTNALTADSLEAVLDTTRTFWVGENAVSVRRAAQYKARADSLDQKLLVLSAARANASVTVKPLDATLAGTSTTDNADSVRSATFDGYREPYTIHAEVNIPRPPQTPGLHLQVALDTADIQVRVLCGERANRGVKPASILFSTPRWLGVRIDSAQVSPVVCQSNLRVPSIHGPGYYAIRAGGVLGIILLLTQVF